MSTEVRPSNPSYSVPYELMNRIYNVLAHYANETTYEAPRIGGVAQGCPRGEPPTPGHLVWSARWLLRELEHEVLKRDAWDWIGKYEPAGQHCDTCRCKAALCVGAEHIERLRAALARIDVLAPEEPTPGLRGGDIGFRCGEVAREALYSECSPFGHEGGNACCPEATVTVTHEHAWEGNPAQCAICGSWRALASDEAAPADETFAGTSSVGCAHPVGNYVCQTCGVTVGNP